MTSEGAARLIVYTRSMGRRLSGPGDAPTSPVPARPHYRRTNMDDRICSTANCLGKVSRRSWCEKHYRRWLKYGDPNAEVQTRDWQEKYNWVLQVVTDTNRNGCRDWPWAKNRKGYPIIGARPGIASRLVTHLALELDGRPRPDDASALHSCDRPMCLAPWHLRWGTAAENSADMVARGRQSRQFGSDNPRVRLTDDQVRDVRERRANGETCRSIGDDLGLHHSYISRLSRGLRRETVR